MKKVALILIAFLFVVDMSHAQQVGQYSLYMQNPYLINPAAAGLYRHLDITAGYRKQWAGFTDSPQTYYVSGNMMLSKQRRSPKASSIRISSPGDYNAFEKGRGIGHAVGGFVGVDQFGAFEKTVVSGTYALHLPLSNKLNFSFGTNVGFSSFSFDQNKIKLENSGDQLYSNFIANAGQNSSELNIDFGGWLYSRKFFIGYSSIQLLGNNFSFGEDTEGKLQAIHQFMGGYHFRLNQDLTLIPNVLVKYTTVSPMLYDLGLRIDYQDRLWAGAAYRNTDAIVAMAGLYLSDMFKMGYAFDLATTNTGAFNSASHELMFGVMLFGNKSASSANF